MASWEIVSSDLGEQYEAAIELIRSKQSFVVTSHKEPDGDAIGSALGLFHMLKALGKHVEIFFEEPLPDAFCFLPGVEGIRHELGEQRYDVLCVVDCDRPSKLALKPEHIADELLVFDHHKELFDAASVEVLDRGAAAVGVMLLELGRRLGVEFSQTIAVCLYVSIVSDTGGFRYSSTDPRAHRAVGDLLEYGIDVWEVSSHLFEENSLARIKLLGEVLASIELSECRKIAAFPLSYVQLAAHQLVNAEIDGMINFARSIRDVELAAQVFEVEPGRIEITLRSRGRVSAGEVAARMGGSGGRNAATIVTTGEFDILLKDLSSALSSLNH